jgi:thiol-disulfide isomerase/thioredoxin
MSFSSSHRLQRRHWLAAALSAGLPAVAQTATIRWPAQTRLLDGSQRSAADWQGKPLLLVFWATHCPFCLRHNANLHQQMLQWPEGPAVLAVAMDRDPTVVQRYMQRHGYRFPVTLDDANWRQALAVRRVLPTTVPINRHGRIGQIVSGEMFPEDLLQLARWADADMALPG